MLFYISYTECTLVFLVLTIRFALQPYLNCLTVSQVKAAVAALSNIRGLGWPTGFEQQRQRAGNLDLLDWLRAMFGFQASLQTVKVI